MKTYDKYLEEARDADITAVSSKLKGLILTVRKFGAAIRTDDSSKLTKAIMGGSPVYIAKVKENLDFVKGFVASIKD